jgi:rhamnosyltransferase
VNAPLVSIVLVTRNGMADLPALFAALARQHVDFSFEVIAVDTSSTDGTAEFLRERARLLLTIPPEAFNHGLTRNLGIQHARGELVVLLVQDAIPASDDWLVALTAPLRRSPLVAGAFARQRPRQEASVITRYYLKFWVALSETARIESLAGQAEFVSLPPKERFMRCAFDNVCSCIRRSVWSQIPFRPTPIAEDLGWAKDALVAGYRIVYVPESLVVHSHDRSSWYEFQRTYLLHRRLFELFQLRTIPTARQLARAIASSLTLHLRLISEGSGTRKPLTTWTRAAALAVAWPLGQYVGGLSAAKAWKPIRSRIV